MGSCDFPFCVIFRHFSRKDASRPADLHAIAIGGILNCSAHVFLLLLGIGTSIAAIDETKYSVKFFFCKHLR